MKWFQHRSDSHNDLKLQKVIKKYGMQGYGLYWLCVELVANQGHNLAIKNNEGWEDALEFNSRLKPEMILEMVQFFAEMNLISKSSLSKGILSIPKLANYSDDYSRKRVRTLSVQTPDNIPLDKNTLDKNTLDNTSFDQFWSLYPKKVAKRKAELAWKKIKPSEHPLIYADVQKRSTSEDWHKNNGQFIPYPATYLNGERWKDQASALSAAAPPKRICRRCKGDQDTGWMQGDGGWIHIDCAVKSPEGLRKLGQMKSEVFKSIK